MILDKANQLSAAQAVTTTAPSVNQIDLGPKSGGGNASGQSAGVEMLFTVDATFAGGTSLAIQVRSSDSANMASPVVHFVSDAIPVAQLTAGARLPFTPRMPVAPRRYLDVNYIVVGTMTAGAISANVTVDRQMGY